MPYDGEFAGYRPLQRIVETERVQQLLRKSRVFQPNDTNARVLPKNAPSTFATLPAYVVAIDGSNAEVDVRNGYPGAKIGYCTVASVLLNLAEMGTISWKHSIGGVGSVSTSVSSRCFATDRYPGGKLNC